MGFAALLSQSFRMTLRDWRSGEVRLLVVALAVAVAALSSVAFFVDRAQRALERDAAMFIGGDLALDSDRPIDPSIGTQAGELGLQVAQTVTFPSMAVSGLHPERNVLTALKAVSSAYPLRGAIKLRGARGEIAAAGGTPGGHGAGAAGQPRDVPPAGGRRSAIRRALLQLVAAAAAARPTAAVAAGRAAGSARGAGARAPVPDAGGAARCDAGCGGGRHGGTPLFAAPDRQLRGAALPGPAAARPGGPVRSAVRLGRLHRMRRRGA